ncbi:MAG TPA: hypothetical protein VIM86_08510 [Thermodesulfobacteriota bacterium]
MCLTECGAPPSSAVPFEGVSGASAVFAAAAEAAIRARGTFDPRVITEGTIAYLFRLDSGFTLIYRNSAGPITDHEREAMARVRRTDVAIVAYIGTEPLFMAIRDTRPEPTTISPLYREPVCLDVGRRKRRATRTTASTGAVAAGRRITVDLARARWPGMRERHHPPRPSCLPRRASSTRPRRKTRNRDAAPSARTWNSSASTTCRDARPTSRSS